MIAAIVIGIPILAALGIFIGLRVLIWIAEKKARKLKPQRYIVTRGGDGGWNSTHLE